MNSLFTSPSIWFTGEDSNFEIDSATGMIRTKQVLDYEIATQTTFTLTGTVTDHAGHSATQQITINLQNINDNTPEFSPNIYYVDVQENTAMGRLKGLIMYLHTGSQGHRFFFIFIPS